MSQYAYKCIWKCTSPFPEVQDKHNSLSQEQDLEVLNHLHLEAYKGFMCWKPTFLKRFGLGISFQHANTKFRWSKKQNQDFHMDTKASQFASKNGKTRWLKPQWEEQSFLPETT